MVIAQQEAICAGLEEQLGLEPNQPIPAERNIPNPPPPDTSDPFASRPLRKLVDVVADDYEAPASALSTADSASAVEAGLSTERSETEEQHRRSAHEWCMDCDVLVLQLQDTVRRVTSGQPLKGICYSCACRWLGIPERQIEDEAESQSVYDQDSVNEAGVDEGKQE